MHTETYDFKTIEAKWQKKWEESASTSISGPEDLTKKFYCLVMFPYPSGKIHMGHARNYCIGDVIARYKKMRGFEILHPIGWDAFGLPAENAAIERSINPNTWTRQNIADMRQDIKSLGICYDWNREFATCDPEYYKWNQWFFIQMFKKGLAYKKKSSVNWCPKCQTVLANEQVHEGTCWRCHAHIDQKELEQWFLKITDYAERLLEDLKLLEGKWPDEVVAMQRNWIGKSIGAEINFRILDTGYSIPDTGKVKDSNQQPVTSNQQLSSDIKVFTTRPDTLFGCTFMVIAPEHPLVNQILEDRIQKSDQDLKVKIKKYCDQVKMESRMERTAAEHEKTGVFSGLYAVNPVNQKKVPIWIADYVLSDYGTGAIMAVPAHDQRDFDFARKFNLPIIQVIQPKDDTRTLNNSQLSTLNSQLAKAYEAEGILINSGEFDGLDHETAKKKITQKLEQQGLGKEAVTYRIRDWLISRQRYWGTPIPIIYCSKCGTVPTHEKDLPVLLPENVQFTGKGESPLAQEPSFINTKCPQCGGKAKRETDTMDTFVDSSWYFLRYCDPKNSELPFDSKKINAWLPVDQYVGGIEHACMHLVYSRFFHKVVYDLGMSDAVEPFQRLLTQGMVTLGGSAMSKSRGNIVAVEDMANQYGADTARLFILFASPPKNQLEWSEDGVQGAWRFLNRVWRMSQKIKGMPVSQLSTLNSQLIRKTHQTIKKVQDDIEREYQFNTAIAALMELLNALTDYANLGDSASQEALKTLVLLLFPFAPHLTSEIWEQLGYDPKELSKFPEYQPELIQESVVEIVIQLNGRLKTRISLSVEEAKDEKTVASQAQKALETKGGALSFRSYKFVPGRLINFIADQTVEAKNG